jgi:hypothetical protein
LTAQTAEGAESWLRVRFKVRRACLLTLGLVVQGFSFMDRSAGVWAGDREFVVEYLFSRTCSCPEDLLLTW